MPRKKLVPAPPDKHGYRDEHGVYVSTLKPPYPGPCDHTQEHDAHCCHADCPNGRGKCPKHAWNGRLSAKCNIPFPDSQSGSGGAAIRRGRRKTPTTGR